MDCALWLNRKKVFSADEIKSNLDVASLLGYFAAGSLVEWLETHNGKEYAKKLVRLSPKDPDICDKISRIFGGEPTPYKKFSACAAEQTFLCGSTSFGGNSYKPLSFGSQVGVFAGSLLLTSGRFYNYTGSFYLGSFLFGSGIYEWEWEWEQFFGSFPGGSFSFGSGMSFLRSGRLGSFGSFRYGSFDFGSFGAGSSGSFSDFVQKLPEFAENLDEYDRIMLESIFGCPLNQFGYGIHNI